MATTPEQHFVEAFRSDFDMLYQQKESRLFRAVRVEPQNALSDFFNFIGALDDDMDETAVRHPDTVWTEPAHTRRRVQLAQKTKAIPLDKADKKMMGPYDPTNGYVQALTGYYGRYLDKKILAAIAGAAYTGVDGSTTVQSYASGECRLMNGDGTLVTAGSNFSNTTETTLTIAKLGTLQAILTDAGVPDDGNRFLAMDQMTIEAMLKDTTFGAEEILRLRDIRSGKMSGLFGFNFIVLPAGAFTANATDSGCYETAAWHRDAMLLTTGDGGYAPEIRIDERADKNYTKQIWAGMYSGATRLQGPGVVRVLLKTVTYLT